MALLKRIRSALNENKDVPVRPEHKGWTIKQHKAARDAALQAAHTEMAYHEAQIKKARDKNGTTANREKRNQASWANYREPGRDRQRTNSGWNGVE